MKNQNKLKKWKCNPYKIHVKNSNNKKKKTQVIKELSLQIKKKNKTKKIIKNKN